MDTIASKELKFNFKILPGATKKALDFLSKQDWLIKFNWYLGGGTALALQVGQRKSIDLDFFNIKSNFNPEEILLHFIDNKDWKTDFGEPNTVYGELLGVKVSFISYPFFVPKQEFLQYDSVKILDKTDIAVMKIIAISQRGRKRDFFDAYWCAKNIEPLENIIKRLPVQYPSIAHDFHHILKSLVYFEDAENDPEPEIYFKAGWREVKRFFKKEIPAIVDKIIIQAK